MERVAIVAGIRTAFVRVGGAFANYSAVDLLSHLIKESFSKFNLKEDSIDEIIAGSVLHDPNVPNVTRESLLRAKINPKISAHSVTNNCITGLVAVNHATESIKAGRISSALAGGAEAMSKPTLTFSPKAQDFFLGLNQARSTSQKISALSKFKFRHFKPRVPSPKEPSTGLSMGEHCELMVKDFKISREEQDQWAYDSHQRAAKAQSAGCFSAEIAALAGIDKDNIIRPSTSLEKLASLPSAFDKSSAGTLTAGNSSALTDGASLICLMSESKAKSLGLEILGYVEACEFSAVNPQDGLLMAPPLAFPKILKRTGIKLSDIDIFEFHEAFAGQVLCNLKAIENGWSKYPELQALGKVPREKINLWGGSLAMGHPFSATGGRLILSAVNQLKEHGGKRALLSVCAAGAMGGVMTITRD
jgi:acetyl-CoA acetyltransferase family protein